LPNQPCKRSSNHRRPVITVRLTLFFQGRLRSWSFCSWPLT
jgi:hypothetical protein